MNVIWSQGNKLTHPSDSSVLRDHVQSFGVALHSLSGDQDAVCGIASWCSPIDVFVVSSNLTTDIGLGAIGSDNKISSYLGTILELHSSLKVVVILVTRELTRMSHPSILACSSKVRCRSHPNMAPMGDLYSWAT